MAERARKQILITGGAGLLAPFLAEAGWHLGEVNLTARRGGCIPCDLADAEQVNSLISTAKPDVVIHCAAMTNVDACEADPGGAERANQLTSRNLAASLPAGRQLIYISTDQVYPNTSGPHVEGSEDPINAYGRSKLAGERAALSHAGGVAIRTSFFAPSRTPGRKSLSDFVVESLTAELDITLFVDVLFSPLHGATLASIIFEIAERDLTGTYNAASRDGFNKADFAFKIAEHLDLQTKTATRGKSASLPGRAIRTADLRMDPSRLEKALGHTMPTLQQEIEKL